MQSWTDGGRSGPFVNRLFSSRWSARRIAEVFATLADPGGTGFRNVLRYIRLGNRADGSLSSKTNGRMFWNVAVSLCAAGSCGTRHFLPAGPSVSDAVQYREVLRPSQACVTSIAIVTGFRQVLGPYASREQEGHQQDGHYELSRFHGHF